MMRKPRLKPPYTLDQMRWVFGNAGCPAKVLTVIDASCLAKSPFRRLYGFIQRLVQPLLALTSAGQEWQREREAAKDTPETRRWQSAVKTWQEAQETLRVFVSERQRKHDVDN